MSTKHKTSRDVPSAILIARLIELSDAATKGSASINHEFYISTPARFDHDADLVLSGAAQRIEDLEHRVSMLEDELEA